MKMHTNQWLWSAIAVGCVASAATAQTPFVDNFDSYVVGTVINGQGGWKQWDSAPNVTSIIEDSTSGFALSGNSVSVDAVLAGQTSDLVHEFTGFIAGTGKHTLRAYTYNPSGTTDSWFFLIMNRYADFGPYDWAAQLTMKPSTGTWVVDAGSAATASGPLIQDAWVEVRADIDLDGTGTFGTGTNDSIQVYYNGASTAPAYCYSCGVFGGVSVALANSIAAIDLYHLPATVAGPPSQRCYWDDFSLVNGFPPAVPTVIACTPNTNSQGCSPSIGFSGNSSSTKISGFDVITTNVRFPKPGLYLYSLSNTAPLGSPLGFGTLCIGGPVKRTVGFLAGGVPAVPDCGGVFKLDMNKFRAGGYGAPPPAPAPYLSTAGSVVNIQFWGRDNGFAAPNNSSLSDVLQFTVGG